MKRALWQPEANVRTDTNYWPEFDRPKPIYLELFSNPDHPPATVERIEEEKLPLDAAPKAQRMMSQLSERLRKIGFVPVVIHLSHFALSQPETRGFASCIWSHQWLGEHYVESMKGNITHDANAGPITPSAGLYKRPFWHSRLTRAMGKSGASFTPCDDPPTIRFYSHPFSKNGVEEPEQVAVFIKTFHERVVRDHSVEIPQVLLSDFIAIPFLRMNVEEQLADAQLPIQGGAFYALGHFEPLIDENTLEQDHRAHIYHNIDKDILLMRTEMELGVSERLRQLFVDQTKEIERSNRQLREALLSRAATHESRSFASSLEGALDEFGDATVGGDTESARRLVEKIKRITAIIRTVTDALVEPFQTVPASWTLGEAVEIAAALLWYTPTEKIWRNTGQKDEDVLLFLATYAKKFESFEALLQPIHGDLGKCVVALRNLIDNAIKGCGDEYDSRNRLTTFENAVHKTRPFFMRIESYDDEMGPHVVIANTACLPNETYDLSYDCGSNQPKLVGFYLPQEQHRLAPQRSEDQNPKSLSMKGATLSQLILNGLGFSVCLERWIENGEIKGTRTVISRL